MFNLNKGTYLFELTHEEEWIPFEIKKEFEAFSTFQASLRHDKFSKSKKPVAGLAVLNSQASLRHDKFSKSQKPVAGLAVLRSNIPVADYATSQASLRHGKFSKSKKPVAGLAVLRSNISLFRRVSATGNFQSHRSQLRDSP